MRRLLGHYDDPTVDHVSSKLIAINSSDSASNLLIKNLVTLKTGRLYSDELDSF